MGGALNAYIWLCLKCVLFLPDILLVLCYTNSKNICLTIHYLHFMYFLHLLLCKLLCLNVDVIGFALHMPTFIFNYFAYKINNIYDNN